MKIYYNEEYRCQMVLKSDHDSAVKELQEERDRFKKLAVDREICLSEMAHRELRLEKRVTEHSHDLQVTIDKHNVTRDKLQTLEQKLAQLQAKPPIIMTEQEAGLNRKLAKRNSDLVEKLADYEKALSLSKLEIYKECAHPQSVWYECHVTGPQRSVLEKWKEKV